MKLGLKRLTKRPALPGHRPRAERPRPDVRLPQYVQFEKNRRFAWILYLCAAVACFAYGFGFALYVPYLIVAFVAPVAILAIFIVWALPEGDYAPIKLLEPLFLCFFAAVFLWPDYMAIVLPGLPWITLRRLFGIPLALVLLVCVSSSAAFRSAVKDTLMADRVTTTCLIAFLLLQTVSIGLSNDVGGSLNKYIVAQTNFTSIFFVSCFLFRRAGVAERWAKMLLALGWLLCLVGLWEKRLGSVPWAGHIPSFLKVEDPTVMLTLAGMSRAGVGVHRVTGPQSTPLGLAEFLGLTLPFAINFVLGRYPIALKMLAGLYIPVTFYVILTTDSRLGVIAALVGMLFYLLLWATANWRNRKASIIAPALVLAYPFFFAVIMVATVVVGRLRVLVWGGGSEAASNDGRREQWMMGIPKIFHRPVGYGIGRSAETLDYRISDGGLSIDSYYLSVMLEYGLLGFIFYYATFGRAAWIGTKASMADSNDRELRLLLPATVSIFAFIIIKAVFSQEDNHSLAFMLLGAILALTARTQQQRPVDT